MSETTDTKNSQWARFVVMDTTLTTTERTVAMVLWANMAPGGYVTWRRHAAADAAGLTIKTWDRAIKTLTECGWLEKDVLYDLDGGVQASVYRRVMP